MRVIVKRLAAPSRHRQREDPWRESRGRNGGAANLVSDAIDVGCGSAALLCINVCGKSREEFVQGQRSRSLSMRGLRAIEELLGVEEVGIAKSGKEHPRPQLEPPANSLCVCRTGTLCWERIVEDPRRKKIWRWVASVGVRETLLLLWLCQPCLERGAVRKTCMMTGDHESEQLASWARRIDGLERAGR